jgi:hypothetical protein
MITPGSIEDWTLFAGMLGALSALAASGHRWVLRETQTTSERAGYRPLPAPSTLPDRVSR